MDWAAYRKLLLISILAFAFLTRVWGIHTPTAYIFDEVYHASTAKLIARNDERAFEWYSQAAEENAAIDWLHPPLAKYTQAFFISTFSETSFAWRFSSVLFGVGLIYLLYLLSEELFGDYKLSLLAAFLASLDGLLLVMSRIAMNDVHVSFFILLTLIFYLKYKKTSNKKQKFKKLFLVGLSAGLAMASKWSGIFVLFIIWLFEVKNLNKNYLRYFAFLIILPVFVYILSYSQMFLQGKSLFCFQKEAIENTCYYGQIKFKNIIFWQGHWSHFVELHHQIFHYQTHLEATHAYQSRPWQWFLNLRPVWVWVEYLEGSRADIYAQGNSMLFWLGAAAAIYTLFYLFKTKFKNKKLLFLLLSYFAVWLPWQFSPRIMFFYHYLPAVPLLCILLAYWLTKLNKYYLYFILFLIILNFVLFYPHWVGLAMPNFWKDNLYFLFKAWK